MQLHFYHAFRVTKKFKSTTILALEFLFSQPGLNYCFLQSSAKSTLKLSNALFFFFFLHLT